MEKNPYNCDAAMLQRMKGVDMATEVVKNEFSKDERNMLYIALGVMIDQQRRAATKEQNETIKDLRLNDVAKLSALQNRVMSKEIV